MLILMMFDKHLELYLRCYILHILINSMVFYSFSLQPSQLNDLFNFCQKTVLRFSHWKIRGSTYIRSYAVVAVVGANNFQSSSWKLQ
jgi:hypothetical protein